MCYNKRMIELGKEVKNVVTGHVGIVLSKVEFLSGIVQYGVQPGACKEEPDPRIIYTDEPYLIPTGKSIEVKKKLEMGFHGKKK